MCNTEKIADINEDSFERLNNLLKDGKRFEIFPIKRKKGLKVMRFDCTGKLDFLSLENDVPGLNANVVDLLNLAGSNFFDKHSIFCIYKSEKNNDCSTKLDTFLQAGGRLRICSHNDKICMSVKRKYKKQLKVEATDLEKALVAIETRL